MPRCNLLGVHEAATARVLHNRIANVHMRGHAAQEELKIVHSVVQPRYFVPIHGEYRHMALHADLARSLGMPDQNIFVLTDGMVVVILAIEKNTGRLVGHPEVVSRGFVDIEESEELLQRTRKMVVASLEGADHIAEWGVVNTKVKDAIAQFLYEETHRRPMVLPVSVEA